MSRAVGPFRSVCMRVIRAALSACLLVLLRGLSEDGFLFRGVFCWCREGEVGNGLL